MRPEFVETDGAGRPEAFVISKNMRRRLVDDAVRGGLLIATERGLEFLFGNAREGLPARGLIFGNAQVRKGLTVVDMVAPRD